MKKLPSNPYILLSVINTKLRDSYDSLASLCDDLEESQEEIENILRNIGYEYDAKNNKFILI